MAAPIVLAVVFVVTFLGLGQAAVRTPRDPFLRVTRGMVAFSVLMTVLAPLAGLVLLVPVLGARRMARTPVPETVDALLERY